jgi:hypothetical protein
MVFRSVGLVSDLPDEARQLTRDRDGDRGAFLRARCVEGRPAAVQPDLRTPGLRLTQRHR